MRARAIVLNGDQILVIKRRKQGRSYAALPGGGIEPGESAAEAVLRELAEETGLRGTIVAELDPLPDTRLFVVHASGHPVLGEPEASKQNPWNRYEPAWVDVADLVALDLGPSEVVPLITALAQAGPVDRP